VHFQTSCTSEAQEKFDRGLAMVHSFVYPYSVAAFTEAAAADRTCAIAYWGIAISHRPSLDEAASATRKTAGAVKVNLHRALKTLRARLSGKEGST
jgi:hypothetical protein